jgi:hypothetical protein
MGMIDDQLAESRPGKPFDMVNDQGFSRDRQERFRQLIGQGAHPLATAGGQYHGFHFVNEVVCLGNNVTGSVDKRILISVHPETGMGT